MIKHKQNKKTSDIYSLPLKCDLCSTFSIKQTQRTFLRAHDGWSWSQPVGGGGEGRPGGDIPAEKGGMQLATCWEYNCVVCLPAVLLLKMTQSKWSSVVLWKWLVCHHISEQTTLSHRHWGLGKQRWMATHSGEGCSSLWGRRREAGLYSLEASALMSLLIVSSWFFV